MNNREKLEEMKRYKEITDGIKDKVSNQAHSLTVCIYTGKLNEIRMEASKGCGGDYWMNGLKYECEGKKEYSTRFCKDCINLIKEIDALLGDRE